MQTAIRVSQRILRLKLKVEQALGQPQGLDGMRFSSVKDSSEHIVFMDSDLIRHGDYNLRWHDKTKGNICMADGSVVFRELPPVATDQDLGYGKWW